MPKPHVVMQKQVRERLQGKAGNARMAEIRTLLRELPPFSDGPYGTVRKKLMSELVIAKKKSKQAHRDDTYRVEKEGARQLCLVGLPNTGKSALFMSLTGKYSRQGEYSFTTLAPVAGLITWKDAKLQIIDLPGLPLSLDHKKSVDIKLLDYIRGQSYLVWVVGLDADPISQFNAIRSAVGDSSHRRVVVVGTKADIASSEHAERFMNAVQGYTSVIVSAAGGENIESMKDLLYQQSGLLRIFLRVPGEKHMDPIHVDVGSTVRTVINTLHRDMAGRLRSARVWGRSAKFDGQNVGLDHCLAEDDILELHLRS